MAQVPNDEISTVQQEPLPGRAIPRFDAQVSPADFGAGLGQGLQSASNDIEQVQRENAAKQKQLQDKANADADRVQLAGAITKMSMARNAIEFGKDPNDPSAAYRQTGAGLVTLPEDAGAKFDKAATEISSGLTPHQQSMFSERVASEKDSLDLSLRRYQFQQADREAQETFTNAKTQAIQTVGLNYRDPAAIPKALEDVYNAGMSLATRGGKDQVEAYKLSGYTREADQVIESAIGGHLADGDIRGAQRDLNAYAKTLSSGQVKDSLENRIRAAGDRIDAQLKDQSRDKIMDQQKAALAGLPGWEGLASPTDYARVHKNDAARQQDFTAKLAAVGSAEKLFDTMNPQQIQQHLESTKPTVATPGVAQDLEVQRMMEQAAERSKKSRQADPAAFAINSGQGWKPIDFSDPKAAAAELGTRSNTAPQIGENLGVRMQLLSKPEAAQLANHLNGLPSDQKLVALTALHASLPNDKAYFSVLGQVLPHSPVTAIVGQKIDRPSEWDAPAWFDPKHTVDPSSGQRILAGESILNPVKGGEKEEKGSFKGGFPMPPASGAGSMQEYFARNTKDVFVNRAQVADAHFSAFRDSYAAIAAQNGDYSGRFIDKYAKQALEDSVGKPVQIGKGNVVPPNGMDPSKFEGAVTQAIKSTVTAAGAKADFADRIAGYQLEEQGAVGSGRYKLKSGNAYLTRPDDRSKDLVIDLGGT